MRGRHASGDRCLLLLALFALAACERGASTADANDVVVVQGHRTGPAPTPPRPHATPSPRVAIPTIAAAPPGPNPQLAKPAFRSPPLPPELVGDGGLIPLPLPLPPPPPPSAFGQANQQ